MRRGLWVFYVRRACNALLSTAPRRVVLSASCQAPLPSRGVRNENRWSAAIPQFHWPRKQNNYECTMDQELADAAAYAPGRRCARSHLMAALFWLKWRHGRHIEIMTSCHPNKKKNNKMRSDIRSVPDPKKMTRFAVNQSIRAFV